MKIKNLLLAPLFFFIAGIAAYIVPCTISYIAGAAFSIILGALFLQRQKVFTVKNIGLCLIFFCLGITQTWLQEKIHDKASSFFTKKKKFSMALF